MSLPDLPGLLQRDRAAFTRAVSEARSPDIADTLRELSASDAARMMAALPFDVAVQVFDEPELLNYRCAIVQEMDQSSVARLVDAMSSDQQADLFRELPESHRARLLELLDPITKQTLTMLLRYRPVSAGGIMTTEFVSMPTTWTVEEALKHISTVGRAKETVYAIYLLDPKDQTLVRVVSLRDLMVSDRTKHVGDIAPPRLPLAVSPSTDREDVARLISKYNLLAVPVVDDTRHVIGIVTVDDVIDAMVRDHTSEAQRFGGLEALEEPYPKISFARMIRKRAGWLAALFLGEMLTATAMGYFEGEIARAVVLSLFIPLIISSGGNSGSQATSLIIRSLALRELTLRDWWRVAFRELPTGLALGGILGVIGIARIVLWQKLGWYQYGDHWLLIAFTVGFSLVGVVTFGSLAGSMLPFLLKKLGFDPASASAPFVATLVDVTGLVIYFTVALIVLRGALL
jgi:magnesium transporter